MATQLHCARIGCAAPVTYAKPLCYEHWKEFDRHLLHECEKCHRFYDIFEEDYPYESEDPAVHPDDWNVVMPPDLCSDCTRGKGVPVHAHAPVEHQIRYLYILKLDGGQYYVGQSNDLEIRLKEHEDGLTRSTAGKHPKLVWFERWEGETKELNAEEDFLTQMANKQPRRLRQMIADWQGPLRLVDWNA